MDLSSLYKSSKVIEIVSQAPHLSINFAISAIQAVRRVLQGALWVMGSPRRQRQIWVCTQGLQWVLRSLTLMPEASV